MRLRTWAVAALLIPAALTACGDPAAPPPPLPPPPPPPVGALRVYTATLGDDPDTDGYQLRVDDADPVELDATGSLELELDSGKHRLNLLGVASHCSVDVATPLEVQVSRDSVTIVRFEIDCPLTGARISVSTGGLDRDTSGYTVEVDGVARDRLDQADALLIRLEPGERTIALTGLESNCTAEEPSRTVAIVRGETATVAFGVVCTAATGVIRVVVDASGSDLNGSYYALVDGRSHLTSYPAPGYVDASPGPHTVSLVPPGNCTVHTRPQEVTVTAGGLVRDTVGVSFSVGCVGAFGYLRVTVGTFGSVPQQDLSVWICDWADAYYCTYSEHTRLGSVLPGGTAVFGVDGGVHRAWLQDLVPRCTGPTVFHPSDPFTITHGDTVSVTLGVLC